MANGAVVITNFCGIGEAFGAIVKERSIEGLHILASRKCPREKGIIENFESMGVPYKIHELSDDIWEDAIKKVSGIVGLYPREKLLMVLDGKHCQECMIEYPAVIAAFINGIPVFVARKGKIIAFPRLKFAYENQISDRKRQVLRALKGRNLSLSELSRETKLSLPLVSFHINGNPKSMGLEGMGLVEKRKEGGKEIVKLSTFGSLVIDGYMSEI
jgi:DNA-binding transcriptional ArsR family regulator